MVNGDCPESIGCGNIECPIEPATDYLPWDEAIAVWNRRAPTAPKENEG